MPGIPFAKRLSKLDIIGAVLFAGALSCGIMAVSFGGLLSAWQDQTIIGLFDGSGFLWILFGLQQGFGILCDRAIDCFLYIYSNLGKCVFFMLSKLHLIQDSPSPPISS